jgi:hypothetical protein
MIEKAILRTTSLLALVFGHAGA